MEPGSQRAVALDRGGVPVGPTRRRMLRTVGAIAGLAPLIAACAPGQGPAEPPRAPAGQGTSAPGAPTTAASLGTELNIVQWSHFVPAYDTWFDKWAADWGAKNKLKVTVDHVQNLELPARLAAESAARTGH